MNLSKKKKIALAIIVLAFGLIAIYKYTINNEVIDIVDVTTNIESSAESSAESSVDQLSGSGNAKKDIIKNDEAQISKDIKSAAASIPKNVLDLAVTAYAKAEEKALVSNHKLTIIDYSQPSNKKRMWVIDMDKKKVDINTYVSHGARSGGKIAKDFSNQMESHKSSIGVMKTGGTYMGKRGKSLYLHGLEKNVNDNVFRRHVVIHGATYVNDHKAKSGQVGKSFGCPAVDAKIAKKLISEIAGGSIIFAYYPSTNWIKNSQFL
ncbi:MAG: murein L,D-transpeptidase catalytic domain family protein [Gammaproteobacteria bacterium]|nr:murein L,D-transpeptidase catalytic domain family protein [Gammaproteobacteria bacterium]